MPKVIYETDKGMYGELGEGLEFRSDLEIVPDNSQDSVKGLTVTRGVTFNTSPTIAVSELSGSLLQLKGRAEGLFFHLGGNQYVSNNAWYDGSDASWKYQTADSAAFRWGFRGNQGCFDLDWAIRSTEAGQITSGSASDYSNMPSWGIGLSLTASLGAVTFGKRADRSKVNYNPTDGSSTQVVQHGANAMLDVTGSVKASPSARTLSLAVSGSVEFGCGEPGAFFLLPRLSTDQRDTLTATAGMIIYNTTLGKFQGYQAGSWQNLIA